MLRKIIKINEELCNGCGLCASACHEGAIRMVDGKAKLWREDYCDGLGDCLPACPTGAISFETREAPEYNEAEVMASKAEQGRHAHTGGCPGAAAKTISHAVHEHKESEPLPCGCPGSNSKTINRECEPETAAPAPVSRLNQWPVQIKLVPVNAPYFRGANLLVAADCAAYAYGDFHTRFMKNKITIIGCPKLDMVDYSDKLTEIIKNNDIKSLTVVRMEVPCCGGIENAAIEALKRSGKFIPWQVVTLTTDGNISD